MSNVDVWCPVINALDGRGTHENCTMMEPVNRSHSPGGTGGKQHFAKNVSNLEDYGNVQKLWIYQACGSVGCGGQGCSAPASAGGQQQQQMEERQQTVLPPGGKAKDRGNPCIEAGLRFSSSTTSLQWVSGLCSGQTMYTTPRYACLDNIDYDRIDRAL